MINFTVKGMDSLKKRAEKLADAFEDGRNKAVQESTLAIHREALKLIQENSDGRPEIRYGPKRTVNVSNPGDPPNTDTGRLVQSIKFDITDDTGLVGSNLKYAAWLEFGTETMAPRPWLSTAVENTSKLVGKIFEKWMKKSLDKAVR